MSETSDIAVPADGATLDESVVAFERRPGPRAGQSRAGTNFLGALLTLRRGG